MNTFPGAASQRGHCTKRADFFCIAQEFVRRVGLIEPHLDFLIILEETIGLLQRRCEPLSRRAAQEFDKRNRQEATTPAGDANRYQFRNRPR